MSTMGRLIIWLSRLWFGLGRHERASDMELLLSSVHCDLESRGKNHWWSWGRRKWTGWRARAPFSSVVRCWGYATLLRISSSLASLRRLPCLNLLCMLSPRAASGRRVERVCADAPPDAGGEERLVSASLVVGCLQLTSTEGTFVEAAAGGWMR